MKCVDDAGTVGNSGVSSYEAADRSRVVDPQLDGSPSEVGAIEADKGSNGSHELELTDIGLALRDSVHERYRRRWHGFHSRYGTSVVRELSLSPWFL